MKGVNNIYCSEYKKGCKLSVPLELCGKKLADSQIEMLINSRRTNVIKGFKSKEGTLFNAALKLNNSGKIEFIFDNYGKIRKR